MLTHLLVTECLLNFSDCFSLCGDSFNATKKFEYLLLCSKGDMLPSLTFWAYLVHWHIIHEKSWQLERFCVYRFLEPLSSCFSVAKYRVDRCPIVLEREKKESASQVK